MAGPSVREPVTKLVGRDRERDTIGQLLRSACAGEGRALVIRGQAGIGKTALVDLALAAPDAMTVLKITGVEAEADLAFAGLFGILRPILDCVSELAPTHAAALKGALGLGPSAEPDRLLVSGAVLGLLAAASERQPIVCVVDDAHWLDKPSADALVFAARRLLAERIAMLFLARHDGPRRFEAGGIPEMVLAGLDGDAAADLLNEQAPLATPA